jgi:serine phosphatase RsbU (regulator of sigma subunit)
MPGLPQHLADRLQNVVYSELSVAYLEIDANLVLVGSGGHLSNHGLADLQLGAPAVEQAYFLEGLLPLFESPYFVPSVELAGGRVADLHFHLESGTTWLLLLDVTAERDGKRRLQQKAYEMTLLEEKQAQLNCRLEAANAALLATQRELEAARDAIREELRRKQIELTEARTLQLALVPPPYRDAPGNCALTVDVVLEPAKEVGGDLVDHFCIGSNLLVLVLGDVSGKGAAAALMMARTHSLFRGLAERPDAAELFGKPEAALRIVNRTLSAGNASCMFVTLLIAAYDVAATRLTYVRAGHLPPFLRRLEGTLEKLAHAGGPPLGLLQEAVYASASVDLSPGDQLLIFTDGITEASDPADRLFGDANVANFVAQCEVRGPALLQGLLKRVEAFEDGLPPSDDKAAILLGLESRQQA